MDSSSSSNSEFEQATNNSADEKAIQQRETWD